MINILENSVPVLFMYNNYILIVPAWNKLLPEFFMPLTITLALLLLAGLGFPRKYRLALFWTAVALLYLAASPMVMWITATVTEYHSEWRKAPPPEVTHVVVPGGILAWRPGTEPEYGAMAGIDRLIAGIHLVEEYPDRVLYLAGGAQPGSRQPAESVLMKRFIDEMMKLDTDRIEIDDKSATTIEHARILSEYFEETGQSREIILVTSARNMYRALRTFEAHGIEVHPYATDHTHRGSFFRFPNSLLPSAAALNYNSGAVRELLGRMYYGIRGYS